MHKASAAVSLKKEQHISGFFCIKLWIYFSAWASASGWLLSSIHLLNWKGYVISSVIGILIFWLFIRHESFRKIRWTTLRRRLDQPLPALFFLVSILIFIGGTIYPPNNYDFLTYRFSRILHWEAQSQWHWIHTVNPRMNLSAAGFEWLMTPLFVFFRSDRLFYLINFISFCFLPTLTFSVFRQLGISGKQSWIWMWLLPCGYCFVLQAGSVANDSFSTVYLLTAILFALKARKNIQNFWISCLAICLFTGTKLSNVPLILLWLALSLPILNQMVKYWGRFGMVLICGLLISIVPVLLMNQIYAGNWRGDSSVYDVLRVKPLAGILGNSLQLLVANFIPPIFPWANVWNRSLPELTNLQRSFPRFSLRVGEIQIEETTGIGLGVTLFLLMMILFAKSSRKSLTRDSKLFLLATFASVLLFMASLGSESFPRLFAPYYVILIAAVLLYRNPQMSRFWRKLAFVAALTSLLPLIFSPSRPLWPALSITEKLQKKYPGFHSVQRAFDVYSVYRNRSDSLGPLREFLPKNAKQVGFLSSGDDPEASLWIPYKFRQIVDLAPYDPPCSSGISVVVIHEKVLLPGLKNWMSRNPARILARKNLITKLSVGPEEWIVAEMVCSTSGISHE